MKELSEKRWALIHKLNGQLIEALREKLVREIRWDARDWIVTVLVLQRTIEETEEAVLKTSSTLLNGKIFDSKDKCDLDEGVGDLNRIVPLVKSFSGYCVRTGNILWVDDIESHPLHDEYRLYEYVNIRPGRKFLAEYVFPIRFKAGLNQTVLGALNAETSGKDQFKQTGLHPISEIVLELLDAHAPFLLLSQVATMNDKAIKGLLKAHSNVLDATVRGTGII
jgi:hypothetical protein